MGSIFGVEDADDEPAPLAERIREAQAGPDGALAYSSRTGLALLAFFVLACQCMSTVAAIRRETKSWRWPAFVLALHLRGGVRRGASSSTRSGLLGMP